MSGIVFLRRREADRRPIEPAIFATMLDELAHRGSDGRGKASGSGWQLGVQSFWTTPEDVHQEQPVRNESAGLTFALDGRLDNREDLITSLGLEDQTCLSDPALALAAFERWGEACFEHFVGPFAAVVVDEREQRIVCARDQLGDRSLVYAERGGLLMVASEERALLAHPFVDDTVDEESIARFLAVQATAPGRTFFAQISELPPAHLLIAGRSGLRLKRYWDLDLTSLARRRDQDYVDEFRERLTESVRCRLRSSNRASILMSGGLDSTSVAASAATVNPHPQPPVAISWVFPELPAADERRFMRPVAERHGLEWVQVPGDDLWPLCPGVSWFDHVNGPGEAPSRALWAATTDAMHSRSSRVILTGEHGDHLYFGSQYWLKSLLEEGRLVTAVYGLVSQAVAGSMGLRPRSVPLRAAVARVLGIQRHRSKYASPAPWLTPAGVRLAGHPTGAVGARGMREVHRRKCVDDRWALAGFVSGHQAGLRQGIDIRRPFRDRRLIEFAVRLPEHCLNRSGWSKWILRQSTRGLLPEIVRRRTWGSSHISFVAKGLAQRGRQQVEDVLKNNHAIWHRYVLPQFLWAGFPSRLAQGLDGAETVLAWQCLCLETWSRSRRLRYNPRSASSWVPFERPEDHKCRS